MFGVLQRSGRSTMLSILHSAVQPGRPGLVTRACACSGGGGGPGCFRWRNRLRWTSDEEIVFTTMTQAKTHQCGPWMQKPSLYMLQS
jgi:hypothetical protein